MDINSLSYSIKYRADNKTYIATADKCEHFSLETAFRNIFALTSKRARN